MQHLAHPQITPSSNTLDLKSRGYIKNDIWGRQLWLTLCGAWVDCLETNFRDRETPPVTCEACILLKFAEKAGA